jgi:hypothetical protein
VVESRYGVIPLDALHEMGDITSDSVTQPLRGNDGYLISQSFVTLEIQCEARVVLLDDDASRFLDGLCPNTNLPADEKEDLKRGGGRMRDEDAYHVAREKSDATQGSDFACARLA